MRVAILGATGYTGMVLLRLLCGHPNVESIVPVSRSRKGESILSADPGMAHGVMKLQPVDSRYVSIAEAESLHPDVVFAALPHLASARTCEPFFGKAVVFDLSADMRLKDPAAFLAAYGEASPCPHLAEKAVYGLADAYPDRIREADIVAVPGCYPTASLLPLLPILQEFGAGGLVTINALSGISGAGKKVKENYLFCERTENCGAYSPGRSHRHIAEMLQESRVLVPDIDMIFTPHLVPLSRGMAVTTSMRVQGELSDPAIQDVLEQRYQGSPFVRISPGAIPETGDVRGTNRCDISWHLDGEDLFLFSAIDNLVKGASGQAVQCMNLRYGFPVDAGLPTASTV